MMAVRKHPNGVTVPMIQREPKDVAADAGAAAKSIARLTARATPPESCGPAIPVAPARGPVEAVHVRETYVTDAGSIRNRNAGEQGRTAARARDAFDRMTHAAEMVARAQKTTPDLPFTAAQIATGRAYAALWERHESAGAKCSSLEAQTGGSGGQGSYIDAVLRDGERLAAMVQAFGRGYALAPQRATASAEQRRAIPVYHLVHRVCVSDFTLSDVLMWHGWANKTDYRKQLRLALCDALDRIYGM